MPRSRRSGAAIPVIVIVSKTSATLVLRAIKQAQACPGADELYGSGHRRATGGAVRPPAWNMFVRELGFRAEMEVRA